jgi:hypothetical protein
MDQGMAAHLQRDIKVRMPVQEEELDQGSRVDRCHFQGDYRKEVFVTLFVEKLLPLT